MKTQIITLAILFIGITMYAQNNNNYQYDNLNRLTRVTYPNGTVYEYTYDQLGNRTVKVINSAAPLFPDLVVQNQTLGQTTMAAGATITGSCRVANIGDGSAGGQFLKIYLSSNQTYEQGTDIEIGSLYNSAIAAGTNIQLNTNITIPQGTTSGSWYVLFFADATNIVSESNETNNIATIAINIVNCANIQTTSSITHATCGLNNGSVSITPSGGTAPYTYQWSNGSTNATASNLAGNTYQITVTDFYGCIKTSSATVNTITPPSITLTSTNATCGTNNGSASVNVTGGTTPYQYAWSNGQTASSITNLAAGTYTVTVTDANSCTVNGSVNVNTPANISVVLHPTNPTCGSNNGIISAAVNGGTQPYNYSWSNGQNQSSAINLVVGSYTVTVTDASNCQFVTSITLQSSNNMSVSTTSTNATCGNANGTATVNASSGTAPYTYLWSNGQDSQTAVNLAQGSYNVTVSDVNGCQAINFASVNAVLPPELSLVSVPTDCSINNGKVTALVSNGTAPYQYLWSNGNTTNEIANLGIGDYAVTVLDASNCVVNASSTVSYQNLGGAFGSIPTNGLIAHYPFNGNAEDASGNNLHGIVHNNVILTTDRHGNANSAYEFPGVAYNYISVADNSLLHLNEFSVSAWVYTDTDFGGGVIVNKGRDISNGSYRLNSTGVYAQNNYSGINGAYIAQQPEPNTWHMITGIVYQNVAKFYINGQLVQQATLSNNFQYNDTHPLTIGMHYYNGVPNSWTYPFKGKIDDVYIYNRPLNDEEVLTLYRGESNLTLNIGNDTILCSGESINLNAQTGFNSYLWSNGQSGQSVTISNLNQGIHQISVAANACGNVISDTILITVLPLPQSSTTISGPSSVCMGSNAVVFSVNPITNANLYEWTLLDGTVVTTSSNSISLDVSSGFVSGNLKVRGLNSCGAGSYSTKYITVNPLPLSSGSITGWETVCQGQSSVSYSVPIIANATSYVWTLPNGATGTSSTNSINVSFGSNATSGIISVKGLNACGESNVLSKDITVNMRPNQAGAISGDTLVCRGQNSVQYSIPIIDNADSYLWTLPSGVQGVSNTNSIIVNYGSSAVSGNIVVKGISGFCHGISSMKYVNVNAVPNDAGNINGQTNLCKGQNNVTYTVSPILNASSYEWILPNGVVGSSTTNEIIVNVSMFAQSGQVKVRGISMCGEGGYSVLPINISQIPNDAGIISGVEEVCQGQISVNYLVPEIDYATMYNWVLPSGATGVSTTNVINVNYSNTAVSGNITVKGINSCGQGAISELPIVVNPLPMQAGIISGIASVCQGQSAESYTIPPIANATSYVWSLPSGAVGNSTTNTIDVDFNLASSSGVLSVRGENSCGLGNQSSLPITVKLKPSTPVVTLNGMTLMSSFVNGNQWHNQNGLINNAVYQTYSVTSNGDYFTIVTLQGCSSDTSNVVSITNTQIQGVSSGINYKIYPNPFVDELIIEFSEYKERVFYEVYNSIGQIVSKGDFIGRVDINTFEYTPGAYLIRLTNNELYETRKIVKY